MRYQDADFDALSIKHMAVADRPRERMSLYSAQKLSDQELVMVLLGSGTRELPVGKLAKSVVDLFDQKNDCSVDDLVQLPGIGRAKACLIAAALELGRRRGHMVSRMISSPKDLYPLILHYAGRMQEVFLAVSLNGAHEVLSIDVASVGTVSQALVHPREVYALAVEKRASSIIVAHNHPSRNLNPSDEDLQVTRRLTEAGEILGIPLLDHLIFSEDGYLSLRSRGCL